MNRTKEEVEQIVNKSGYKLLGQYMDGKCRKIIIQDNNGYKYDIILRNLINEKSGKSFVNGNNPYSLENIHLWLKINNKSFEICEDNKYINNKEKLKFYHPICNEYFYMDWNTVLDGGNCSVCKGRQVREKTSLAYLRPDLAKEFIKSEHNKTPYEVSLYSHENVYWKCSECGHEWWKCIDKRTGRGDGCKICSQRKKESKVATECKEYFVKNHNAIVEYKLFCTNSRNQWFRCDIYIPDNIFVEIHGLQHYKFTPYFHKVVENFEYKQYLDKIKKEFCQEHGLYIEVDLRKIKTSEDAISYIENILNN